VAADGAHRQRGEGGELRGGVRPVGQPQDESAVGADQAGQALWVPNGLVVGCESLFVPYGHAAAGGSLAAGMMAGDLIVGRFVPAGVRDRCIGPLRLLLAVPYRVFLPGPPAELAVVPGASAGYSAALPLTDRLVSGTDDAIHGQVMGLYSQGMLAWQAIGALIAGGVAAWVPPGRAIGVMAVGSVAVTLLLVPGLRRSRPGEERSRQGEVAA
jgi:hypothetical protein